MYPCLAQMRVRTYTCAHTQPVEPESLLLAKPGAPATPRLAFASQRRSSVAAAMEGGGGGKSDFAYKLLDLGLAKHLGDAASCDGTSAADASSPPTSPIGSTRCVGCGTDAGLYLQAKQRQALLADSVAVDIWALAATLFHLVSGVHPDVAAGAAGAGATGDGGLDASARWDDKGPDETAALPDVRDHAPEALRADISDGCVGTLHASLGAGALARAGGPVSGGVGGSIDRSSIGRPARQCMLLILCVGRGDTGLKTHVDSLVWKATSLIDGGGCFLARLSGQLSLPLSFSELGSRGFQESWRWASGRQILACIATPKYLLTTHCRES